MITSTLVSRIGTDYAARESPGTYSFTDIPLKKKTKILLVEDHVVIQRISRIMLETLGYEVLIATTGQEALTYFNNTFALIFLDIGLPDMSGLEVCKKLRETNPTLNIPIIALTAFSSLQAECYAAGMQDFLAKPVTTAILQKTLIKWLPDHYQINDDAKISGKY